MLKRFKIALGLSVIFFTLFSSMPVYAQNKSNTQYMQKTMSRLLQNELISSLTYTGLRVYFEHNGFTGMAQWAKVQAREELTHYERQLNFVLDSGINAKILPIDEIKYNYSSPLEAFETALAQEIKLSKDFNSTSIEAKQRNLLELVIHLHKFIVEQVEEVRTVGTIIDRLKFSKDNSAAILLIDSQLGKRK